MMPIDVLVVALVGGAVLLLLVLREVRRPVEPDVSGPVATDCALEAEQKRLADLKAEPAAERERSEAAAELAKQEAALVRRELNLERSLADAERSVANATARIEAREALLSTQETELRRQEGELADRQRSVDERERELVRARAGVRAREEGPAEKSELEQRGERVAELEVALDKKESDLARYVGRPQTQLDRLESDWWEKQLGRPLSARR